MHIIYPGVPHLIAVRVDGVDNVDVNSLLSHHTLYYYCLLIINTLVQKYIINTEIIYIINLRYMNYKYLAIVYNLYTIYSVANSFIKMSIFDIEKPSMGYKPHFTNNKLFY